MNNTLKTLVTPLVTSGAIVFALTSCGSGGTAMAPTTQAVISSNVLQFAVGTANLYGAGTALNVVATYRQPNGNSGTLLNSPVITLPAGIPSALAAGSAPTGYDASANAPNGPAPGESAITSTPQTAGSSCSPGTTFGQSGGVFGLGIEPFNAQAQADCTPAATNATGTPFQVAPYPVPLYDSASPSFAGAAGDPNLFVPWGGPPAFLLTGSSVSVVGSTNYPTGTAGVSEGIDVFAGIAPVAGGRYGLSVSVPANTGTTNQAAFFTLPGVVVLGTAVAPAYIPDAAGDGGGSFNIAMPTGATEVYIQVTDVGPAVAGAMSCNGSGTGIPGVGNGTAAAAVGKPVYYTLMTTAPGVIVLPAAVGPGGAPSVCTAALNSATNGVATPADQIVIQVIGFDYDLYHASYPASLGNATPSILGPRGSDDITISPAICQAGLTSCTASLPLLTRRASAVIRK